jgi:hypothetical protein
MGSYDDDLTQDQVRWLRERADARLKEWNKHAAGIGKLVRRLPIRFRWALTAPLDEQPPANTIDERLARLRRNTPKSK